MAHHSGCDSCEHVCEQQAQTADISALAAPWHSGDRGGINTRFGVSDERRGAEHGDRFLRVTRRFRPTTDGIDGVERLYTLPDGKN